MKKSKGKPSPFIQQAGLFMQKKTRLHLKVNEDLILTTMDKLKICLSEHLSKIESKYLWFTPAGILTTIIVVIPTTSFQTFIFGPDTWKAIFFISALIAGYKTYQLYPRGGNDSSIQAVLDEIKENSEILDSSFDGESQEDPGFKVKIEEPKKDSKINGVVRVIGTFQEIPSNGQLALFTISENQKNYYFHMVISNFDEETHKWEGEINFGGRTQYKNFLVVGLISESERLRYEEFRKNNRNSFSFPPNSNSIPDFLEYDKIEIVKVEDEKIENKKP